MKNERITPGDLVLIFRKRAVPILLAFVILALAGLGLGMLLPPKYGATATFYVRNMQSEQVLHNTLQIDAHNFCIMYLTLHLQISHPLSFSSLSTFTFLSVSF